MNSSASFVRLIAFFILRIIALQCECVNLAYCEMVCGRIDCYATAKGSPGNPMTQEELDNVNRLTQLLVAIA